MNKRIILLSPDEVSGGATEVDPLSAAAQGWEAPKYPVLAPDRLIPAKIKTAVKGPVKEHPDRELITITLKPVEDFEYKDKDGQPMKNWTGFHRIGISETTGDDDKRPRTIKDIGADLAMVLKACGMTNKSPRDLINNPSILDGQNVMVKVGLNKASGTFPESNSFKFVPAA